MGMKTKERHAHNKVRAEKECELSTLLHKSGCTVKPGKLRDNGKELFIEHDYIQGTPVSNLVLQEDAHEAILASISAIISALHLHKSVTRDLVLKTPSSRIYWAFFEKHLGKESVGIIKILDEIYAGNEQSIFGLITDRSSENIIIDTRGKIWHIDFDAYRLGLSIENYAQYIFDPQNKISFSNRIFLWQSIVPQNISRYYLEIAIFVIFLQAQYETKHRNRVEQRIKMCKRIMKKLPHLRQGNSKVLTLRAPVEPTRSQGQTHRRRTT